MKKNFLIDIDGTISEDIPNEQPERMENCKVKRGAVAKINALYDEGHTIVFFTSRTYAHKEVTERWLKKRGFKYHYVIYNKPRGGSYIWIDNLDVRSVQFMEGYWETGIPYNEVTVHVQKCRRNCKEFYWAAMREDQLDAYGDTSEEALGRFIIELQECYKECSMPRVSGITVSHEVRELPQ